MSSSRGGLTSPPAGGPNRCSMRSSTLFGRHQPLAFPAPTEMLQRRLRRRMMMKLFDRIKELERTVKLERTVREITDTSTVKGKRR